MWRLRRDIAFITALLLMNPAMPGLAQSEIPKGDTFTWPGELVSVDTATRTATVKARVAYPEAVGELKQFSPGERIWVVWSGLHDYSDAVRQIRRADAGRKVDEPLVMPAELVSPEAPNQYITLRVRVPESALSSLKAMKPGEWVTVTARHRPSSDADAVVAVKPYGASTNAT